MAACCFDFDGTLVVTQSGATFARSVRDWKWIFPQVPARLRALRDAGHRLIIFSNQTVRFKEQMIADALEDAGVREATYVFVAFDKASKKPGTAMYERAFPHLSASLQSRCWPTEPSAPTWSADGRLRLANQLGAFGSVRHPPGSFFVADALGRPGDWSDTDRRFAEAVGLPYFGPHEFFDDDGGEEKEKKETETETETALRMQEVIDNTDTATVTVVVLVGSPASGKSTLCDGWRADMADIVILRGDDPELRTEPRMLRAMRDHVLDARRQQERKVVVMDATHGTAAKRTKAATDARQAGADAVVCVWVNTDMRECLARNKNANRTKPVPPIAIHAFWKRFEAPVFEEEGFDRLDGAIGS